MKIRETPYIVTPMHRTGGYFAPSIFIYAESYEKAKKQVAQQNTLFKRYPEKWALI